MALTLADLSELERAHFYPKFITDLYLSSPEGEALVAEALDREFLNPTQNLTMVRNRSTRIAVENPSRLPLRREFLAWLSTQDRTALD